jgi:hypothetical protein
MVMAVGCPGIVIVVFAGSFAIASRPMGFDSCGMYNCCGGSYAYIENCRV